MVVVAILGIFSVLAVSSMVPAVRRAELGAATDSALAFVTRARFQALANRRCVQVLLLDKVPDHPQELLLRELNSFDCDGTAGGFQTQDMASAPRIRAGLPLWIEIDRVHLEKEGIVAEFLNHPASLTDADGGDCPAGIAVCSEIRFRPTGRVWSSDADLTNDDITLQVRHLETGETQRMVLGSSGVWRTLPGGR